MEISAVIRSMAPIHPFRTARDEKISVENVFIKLSHQGITGYGEAAPNKYFGESADSVLKKLTGLKPLLDTLQIKNSADIRQAWKASWALLKPSRAAQCALDIALWDFLGKLENKSTALLLWGRPPAPLTSSVTLGLFSPDVREARLAALKHFPIIKIKMDNSADTALLHTLHEISGAQIRVDANCSWQNLDIPELCNCLKALSVQFIEQPLPPAMDALMPSILKQSPLPIMADESCTDMQSLSRLSGRFNAINIKLAKCGGLTPGLEMLQAADSAELKVMVGCMLESDLLISAGAALAQKADYVDLDGSWLLADKPFRGPQLEMGIIAPGDEPGLGVEPVNLFQ
jgi:L-alanine-DL-glutamate epimerase-like enolase superfamily enzyme